MTSAEIDPGPIGDDAADAATDAAVSVRDVASARRFEIKVGPELVGWADYREQPDDVRAFTHAEIDPAWGGRGLGSALVRQALDQTRAAGLDFRPDCPFFRSFLERNPDYPAAGMVPRRPA